MRFCADIHKTYFKQNLYRDQRSTPFMSGTLSLQSFMICTINIQMAHYRSCVHKTPDMNEDYQSLSLLIIIKCNFFPSEFTSLYVRVS
jgi:hypothetical protein